MGEGEPQASLHMFLMIDVYEAPTTAHITLLLQFLYTAILTLEYCRDTSNVARLRMEWILSTTGQSGHPSMIDLYDPPTTACTALLLQLY
jgi:hypothetical protein